MKILTATALLLAIALPATAQVGPAHSNRYAEGTSYVRVCTAERGSNLLVRNGPGKNYRVLTQIRDGIKIPNLSEYRRDSNYWMLISANGHRGWVRSDYVCGIE